jgi:hypothetical protein
MTAFRSPWIEGYCSQAERPSGRVDRDHGLDRTRRKSSIEIFRMGYYGGRGARLMTRSAPSRRQAHARAARREEPARVPLGAVDALTIPRLAQRRVPGAADDAAPSQRTTPYWQSYVVFIVRDDRPADILFQCSDNTWQAYNRWPDNYSVYTHPKGVQGPWADVSFDRPYGREAQIEGVVNDPLSVGSGEFLPFEFPLAYWLEQHGYDVTYCSNSDMLTPDRGLKCKAFLSVGPRRVLGHPPVRKRDQNARRGRESAVPLGQLGLLGHAPDAERDGRPNRIIFRGGPYGGDNKYAEEREKDHGPFPHRGPDEGYLMGARNVEPVNGGGDWTCTSPSTGSSPAPA